jgi:O-methyltransferase
MFLLKFFYRITKKLIGVLGYDLSVSRKVTSAETASHLPDKPYQNTPFVRVTPYANYAPWIEDKTFSSIYTTVQNNTMVDIYRSYELWELIKESAKLDGAILEVGVWRGGSGALMAKQAELTGIESTVYLCDTFKGIVKANENDPIHRDGKFANTSKETVEDLIDTLQLKNTKILSGIFPEETEKFVEDNKFRFCHIDVDVYQSAKDIVEWIWPKLVVGGILVFDDYGFVACLGVTKFVNEEKDKNDRLVLYNLNGHGIIIKIK